MRQLATLRTAPLVSLLLAGALAGCLPQTDNAPRPAVPEQNGAADLSAPSDEELLLLGDGGSLSASQIFNLILLPLISPTCRGCHGGRQGDLGPPFMASSKPDSYDPYLTMKAWRNFAPDIAETSLLVTRGPHEGPALDLDQEAATLRWLRQEKIERDLQTKPSVRPQTRPFSPKTDGTTLNIIDLAQVDAKLNGATLQFTAVTKPNVRGISLRDLRIINKLPGAQPGDQRTIRIARPILIVWSSGNPQPDVGDSLGSFDRSIKLDENEKAPPAGAGGTGIVITPLLTLPIYDAGDALSFAFNIAAPVGLVVSPNTCRPAGLQLFGTQIKEYLGKANACSRAACHNAVNRIGGLNLEPLRDFTGTDYTPLADLCEAFKYYRGNGVLANNMNPTPPVGNTHRFRWGTYTYAGNTTNGCTDNGFAANCYDTYKARLDAWTTADP
jgi:hypothetical protein